MNTCEIKEAQNELEVLIQKTGKRPTNNAELESYKKINNQLQEKIQKTIVALETPVQSTRGAGEWMTSDYIALEAEIALNGTVETALIMAKKIQTYKIQIAENIHLANTPKEKTFRGANKFEIVERMDEWLESNNASLYGSKAMKWDYQSDGQAILTVEYLSTKLR